MDTRQKISSRIHKGYLQFNIKIKINNLVVMWAMYMRSKST